jgi:hypothetical protein
MQNYYKVDDKTVPASVKEHFERIRQQQEQQAQPKQQNPTIPNWGTDPFKEKTMGFCCDEVFKGYIVEDGAYCKFRPGFDGSFKCRCLMLFNPPRVEPICPVEAGTSLGKCSCGGFLPFREDSMYVEYRNPDTGEPYKHPRVEWKPDNRDDKIAYLLMAVEKKPASKARQYFEYVRANVNSVIVKGEYDKFLNSLKDGEARYEAIVDKIDRYIDGRKPNDDADNTCYEEGYIGNTDDFWDLVKVAHADFDYTNNKKRLLNHIAQKWNINKTIIPKLENIAKSIFELEIKWTEAESAYSEKSLPERREICNSFTDTQNQLLSKIEKLGIHDGDGATGRHWTHICNVIAEYKLTELSEISELLRQ